MEPYFSTPERIAQLLVEANKWIGTPFADFSAVPGRSGGASCGYMMLAVLEACGHFPVGITLPRVSWRENVGTKESTIERAFDHWARREQLFGMLSADSELMPGDVVGVRLKTALDHVVMVLPQGLSLSIRLRQKATVAHYQETVIARIWRPLDHAAK
jgi:hypothetical protein